jgi:hypothetical protein
MSESANEETRGETSQCNCKVSKSAQKYGKLELAEEIGRRWAEDNKSVRTLADEFNQTLLKSALNQAGADLLKGEVANLYKLLQSEGTGEDQQIKAKARLDNRGIEPNTLLADFVSYQTIYRHLRRCLDLERDINSDDNDRSKLKARIRALETRTEKVTQKTISQFKDGDEASVKEPKVHLDITVFCEECNASMSLQEIFDGKKCLCHRSED